MHHLARFSAADCAGISTPKVVVPMRRQHVYKAAGTPQPANSLLIDDHSLNSSLDWEGDGALYNINSSIQNLLQSDFPAEAQSHWLGDSLAFSAFFTVSQYPNALWQTSSVPVLSTRELSEAIAEAEDGHVLSHALKCINQAVNNAKVELQAVLGQHADLAKSECTAYLGSSCLWNLVDERLTAAVETAIADDNDAKSVGSPSSDRGRTQRPEETSPEATHSRASAYNNNSMPVVRKSRASAPEYDMKHHPVDDMLGDVDRSSRKRKRGDHGERQQAAKRKVSPIIIDD
ncbi:hypothetical protein Q7P37_009234 [Cladosporium fusiforme]